MRQQLGIRLAGALALGVMGSGCGGGTSGADAHPNADAPPTADAAPPQAIAPADDLLTAADPKLDGFDGWPLAFVVTDGGAAGLRCRVSLARGTASIATIEGTIAAGRCSATWNGLDPTDKPLTPGLVTGTVDLLPAVGETPVAQTTISLDVVRMGIVELHADAPDKVQLMYGSKGGVTHGFWLLPLDRAAFRIGPDASEGSSAVRLEMNDGTPRALPAPWDDVHSPPLDGAASDGVEADSYSLPTAFVAGADVNLTATLNSDVAGTVAGGAPTAGEVRVVAPAELTLAGSADFSAGGQLAAHGVLAPKVGRYDVKLRWTFEAKTAAGGYVAIPGGVTTEIVIYGLVGQPLFDYTTMPHHAWVEVVDAVTRWVNGSTTDPVMVTSDVVEGVYYTLGLVYDHVNGASAYTNYPGNGFENAQFDLSAFSSRAYGSIINCSDAASLVSTYSDMVGVDIRYHILTQPGVGSFDLNFIQAIGWPDFTETPFVGGRGRFSYHAVVGPPDGSFYDGTLLLDGDGTPTAAPSVALLPAAMTPTDYLTDLSSEWMGIATTFDQKVEIQ